tara:strand:+ start:183 stop:482 length:300 start_codon:yes stop_codon:yes gene_type:complete
MEDAWISQDGNDIILEVDIQPSASRSEIVGIEPWRGKVKITILSKPVDGAANLELIRLISKEFNIKKNRIILENGHTSRRKRIRIIDINKSHIQQILGV